MANWCSNTVIFSGSEKNLENLSKLMNKTIELQKLNDWNGQILFGLEGILDGYLFDIRYEDCVLYFESKWITLPNEMVRIAQLFDLTFIYEYSEFGSELYGKYTYDSDGNLYDQCLNDDDIDQCRIKSDDDLDDEEYNLSELDYNKIDELINLCNMECVEIHKSLNQPKT